MKTFKTANYKRAEDISLINILRHNLEKYEDERKAIEVTLGIITHGAFSIFESSKQEEMIQRVLNKYKIFLNER